MELLKDLFFNETYFKQLSQAVHTEFPSLNKSRFVSEAMDGLKDKALNDRLRHTSTVLKNHLPDKYSDALKILDKVIEKMTPGTYTNLVFPDFVGKYGTESIDLSLKALKKYTIYGSSEFAVRVFFKKDFVRTLATAIQWSTDKNDHVRRLASEGSRPRLPWSFKLDEVINNPKYTSPILQQLKADTSLYVRKSVANHLNDIAKDHPDYMLDFIADWDKNYEHTHWIIKHACRTLIKKGNARALSLFDVSHGAQVKVTAFNANPHELILGSNLALQSSIKSTSNEIQKLIIDYVIHYVKKDGKTTPKVFKWKEISMAPGQIIKLEKNQKITDFTTRIHYPGKHKIELQINGKIMKETFFMLAIL